MMASKVPITGSDSVIRVRTASRESPASSDQWSCGMQQADVQLRAMSNVRGMQIYERIHLHQRCRRAPCGESGGGASMPPLPRHRSLTRLPNQPRDGVGAPSGPFWHLHSR